MRLLSYTACLLLSACLFAFKGAPAPNSLLTFQTGQGPVSLSSNGVLVEVQSNGPAFRLRFKPDVFAEGQQADKKKLLPILMADAYGVVEFSGNLAKAPSTLAVGKATTVVATGTLNLFGQRMQQQIPVTITRKKDGSLAYACTLLLDIDKDATAKQRAAGLGVSGPVVLKVTQL